MFLLYGVDDLSIEVWQKHGLDGDEDEGEKIEEGGQWMGACVAHERGAHGEVRGWICCLYHYSSRRKKPRCVAFVSRV